MNFYYYFILLQCTSFLLLILDLSPIFKYNLSALYQDFNRSKNYIISMQPIQDLDVREAVRQKKESIRNSLKMKFQTNVQKIQDTKEKEEEKGEIDHKKNFSNLAQARFSKEKVIDEDFDYYFEKISKIGEGCHSVVYSCYNKSNMEKFAVKITRKKDLQHFQDIRESFIIMKKLNHENILKPEFLFMNQKLRTCHLVSQLCDYPDLEKYSTQNKTLDEGEVAFILQEVIRTLEYIHAHGACHGDIKQDNILYNPKLKKLKIIDFQLCKMTKYAHEHLQIMSNSGPISYRAPETFLGQIHCEKVDIWATGVMAYQLLTGKHPFASKYRAEKINKICYHEPDYEIVPEAARNFLKQMLMKNPEDRISAHEALHSKFFLIHSESPHSLIKFSHHSQSLKTIDTEHIASRRHKKSHDTDCTEQLMGDFEGEAKVLKCSKRTP